MYLGSPWYNKFYNKALLTSEQDRIPHANQLLNGILCITRGMLILYCTVQISHNTYEKNEEGL